MSLEVGKRTLGETVYIPKQMLTESVPGVVYELLISTKGIKEPKKVAETLQMEIPIRFKGAEVLWIRIDGDRIRIQIKGSPFLWAIFLLWLPEILALIGIIVVLISVFLVAAAIPSWLWGFMFTGLGLILIGPTLGSLIRRMLKPTPPPP